jgi:hypothetical protein
LIVPRLTTPRLVAILTTLICLSATTLVVVAPGTTACLLIDLAGFDALPDGTRVKRTTSPVAQASIIGLQTRARARIEQTFGTPRANPIVAVFDDAKSLWPLGLNTYGSPHFIGSRACVFIGPNGQNVDVVAHELMHVELWDRVGVWKRATTIPTWLDEGVAMQVDHRPEYSLPVNPTMITSSVRNLGSPRQFNRGTDAQLTEHYAFAKSEVAAWLLTANPMTLYSRLDRIRTGTPFQTALTN